MNGCSDPGSLIFYEIQDYSSDLDAEYFKISMDSISNQIRFTALSGGSSSGSVTMTVIGTLPDGASATFTFIVKASTC